MDFAARGTKALSALVECAAAQQHSQWGEDVALLPLLVRAARRGDGPPTTVEIGARVTTASGRASNTLMLERCLGWRALLIEGNTKNYARLLQADRPLSTKVNSAVCSGGGVGNVLMTAHGEGVAADASQLSRARQEKTSRQLWYSWERRRGRNHTRGPPLEKVPCRELRALMKDEAGWRRATFLSLDVEGAEELVLRTVRPDAFDVILVEMDGVDPNKDARVERAILDAGLNRTRLRACAHCRTPVSRVYARPALCEGSGAADGAAQAAQLLRRGLVTGAAATIARRFLEPLECM